MTSWHNIQTVPFSNTPSWKMQACSIFLVVVAAMCCLVSRIIDQNVVDWKANWTEKWTCVRRTKRLCTVHRPLSLISKVTARLTLCDIIYSTEWELILCFFSSPETASIRVVMQTPPQVGIVHATAAVSPQVCDGWWHWCELGLWPCQPLAWV